MQPYQLVVDPVTGSTNAIFRRADAAYIPPDTNNKDYNDFLTWQSAGNTPDPAP